MSKERNWKYLQKLIVDAWDAIDPKTSAANCYRVWDAAKPDERSRMFVAACNHRIDAASTIGITVPHVHGVGKDIVDRWIVQYPEKRLQWIALLHALDRFIISVIQVDNI